MIKFAQKSITFIATSALLLNVVAPVFADTTLTITGNGTDTTNRVSIDNTNTTNVVQSNNAVVTNDVKSVATTGGNDANDNTGGNTGISTGNATSKANVSTAVNMNQAVVDPCNCSGDTKVVIAGNGSNSYNKAKLDNSNDTQVFQTNYANVTNNVDSKAKTGGNDANDNTGGTTEIGTGNAKAIANVSTEANANIAQVGGGNGNGGSTQLIIDGNGTRSHNKIYFDNSNDTLLTQGNDAHVTNDVDSIAKTGGNDANDNTGGSTGIGTGNAYAKATVDTMANFNAADVSCGCDGTIKADVSGNGESAYDKIKADLDNTTNVFQGGGHDGKDAGNNFTVENPVDAIAKTGANDTNDNTGTTHIVDPVLNMTGDAWSGSDVSTSGNVNIFGSVPTIHMPSFDFGGNSISFNFDFSAFLGSQI